MTIKNYNIDLIYQKYSQRLFYCSFRIVGNTMDAEEIMHDTLLKYHNYLFKWKIDNTDKWLTSICIRKSIDYLRAKKRLDIKNLELKEETINNYNELCLSDYTEKNNIQEVELIEIIKKSLEELKDKYRLILSLVLFEGYDYKEIELITSIKEGTIRTIYSRGINNLNVIIKNKLQCKI